MSNNQKKIEALELVIEMLQAKLDKLKGENPVALGGPDPEPNPPDPDEGE